ncbi:MAG: tetratricopeptide repeat protein [Clostridia bacterium]
MIIDKIVVIIVALIGILYLSINFITKKKIINMFVVAIQAFFIGLYVAANVYSMAVPLYIEMSILAFAVLLPYIVCFLESKDLRVFGGFSSVSGYMQYKMGKYDVAAEMLNKSARKNPENLKILRALADCHKHLKNYAVARDVYSKIVDLDKRDYVSFYNLGYTLEMLDRKDTAKLMYIQCLKLNSNYIDAMEPLSIIECENGNYEEALRICDEILRINPKKYEANFNKAVIYTGIREFEEALICYQKALEENPKLYVAEYNIGQIAYVKGDYERAEKAFLNSKHCEDYKIKSRYYLAKIYAILKEKRKTIANLQFVMDNDTDYIMEARDDVIFQDVHEFIETYILNKINSSNAEKSNGKAPEINIDDVKKRNYGIGFFDK